jgi:hypothetical protein
LVATFFRSQLYMRTTPDPDDEFVFTPPQSPAPTKPQPVERWEQIKPGVEQSSTTGRLRTNDPQPLKSGLDLGGLAAIDAAKAGGNP